MIFLSSDSNSYPKTKIPKKTQDSKDESKIVDMVLRPTGNKTVDSETLLKDIQKRVWGALKKGYEYSGMAAESEIFLRKNVFKKVNMMVLYVDLVGSTTMALELPSEKLATIISSFAQEMAYTIKQYNGLVLKFVGDAVVGYFNADENALQAADKAVSCAKSMITVIEKGINPILNQYDYPDLMVKIGIDFGTNMVIRYGADENESQVDLIGPAMNIAAKITALAKPNQILIGDDVFTRLHPNLQKFFDEIVWKNKEWRYRSRVTGNLYQVYEYTG